jgi:hypothetical protein
MDRGVLFFGATAPEACWNGAIPGANEVARTMLNVNVFDLTTTRRNVMSAPWFRAMKRHRINFLCCIGLGLSLSARATDFYVAPNALGTGDGSSAANATSVAWLNASSSWGTGAGKIGPGDTVNLVGTITNNLVISGSGTSGNPITIYFQPGAMLSQPAANNFIWCGYQSNLVFDGGVNGTIQNTDCGQDMDYQAASSGIKANGCSNIEIKNLSMINFYIPDPDPNKNMTNLQSYFSSNGGVYANGFGSNISIHNCYFSNVCWAVVMGGGTATNINIYSNNFVNYDHAVNGLGDYVSGINIYNNHFGSPKIWDTNPTNNFYHHDGIYCYYGENTNSFIANVKIMNNLFDGDWGRNNTMMAGCIGDKGQNGWILGTSNWWIFNNIFINTSTNFYINNGYYGFSGENAIMANNTIVGNSISHSLGVGFADPNSQTPNTNVLFINNLIQNCNTFVFSKNPVYGFVSSNNVYAVHSLPDSGGPWHWNNAQQTTYSDFQLASGDIGGLYISSPVVDAAGNPLSGSPVSAAGANLTALGITTDINGDPRPAIGPWTIGAVQVGTGSDSPDPPTELRVPQ